VIPAASFNNRNQPSAKQTFNVAPNMIASSKVQHWLIHADSPMRNSNSLFEHPLLLKLYNISFKTTVMLAHP
jgi:hypothetical protein